MTNRKREFAKLPSLSQETAGKHEERLLFPVAAVCVDASKTKCIAKSGRVCRKENLEGRAEAPVLNSSKPRNEGEDDQELRVGRQVRPLCTEFSTLRIKPHKGVVV